MIQPALQRADFAHFNRRLRERWRALREEIRGTLLRADAERYADIAGEVHDLEDESLADLLTDVTHAEIGRDVEEVRDIEAALQRIAAGTYAICIRCDQPIDRDRTCVLGPIPLYSSGPGQANDVPPNAGWKEV